MLEQIQSTLEADDFMVERQDASAEAPLDQLLIPLELDDGEYITLQIMVLPDPDEEYEAVRLVQFYVGVLEDVAEDKLDQVRQRVCEFNGQIPIVGFNVHPESFVYFRHVLLVPRGNEAVMLPAILECVTLMHYLVETCKSSIVE